MTSVEGGFAAFNADRDPPRPVAGHQQPSGIQCRRRRRGHRPRPRRRGDNGPGTIYVVGAQPVIVDNTFLNNDLDRGGTTSDASPVISIDCNSLNSDYVNDWGRATGLADAFTQYDGNIGPLVQGNILSNNGLNGMLVRPGTLTTPSVWDETGIVYILEGQIIVPNLPTYGGLRLESSDSASLVVKLYGPTAGFTATGAPPASTDLIGGAVQIIGQPGYQVILTSLNDNTVGAGLDLNGNQQDDTVNNSARRCGGRRLEQRPAGSIQQRHQRAGGQRSGAGGHDHGHQRHDRHGPVPGRARRLDHFRRREPPPGVPGPGGNPIRRSQRHQRLQLHRDGRYRCLYRHGQHLVLAGLGPGTGRCRRQRDRPQRQCGARRPGPGRQRRLPGRRGPAFPGRQHVEAL